MMTVRVGWALKGIGMRKRKQRQMLLVIKTNRESIQNFFSIKLILVTLHLHPCQTPAEAAQLEGCWLAQLPMPAFGQLVGATVSALSSTKIYTPYTGTRKQRKASRRGLGEQSLKLGFLMARSMNSLRNKIIKPILVGICC